MPKVELFAPKGFTESPFYAEGRCGPGRGLLEKIVPDKILFLDVSIACKIHDFMYCVGQTNEDKESADRVLKYNLIRLIEAKGGVLKYPRLVLAQGYYLAVASSGGPAFWSGKNETDNLIEVMI